MRIKFPTGVLHLACAGNSNLTVSCMANHIHSTSFFEGLGTKLGQLE